MNKRGQLVALIAIAIAAVVLLVIVWPKLAVLLKGAGSQSTCNLNLLLSAAVKAGSLGFAEIPPGCEANYMTIGKQEIDARKNIAKKRLDKYYQDNTGYYADARTVFNVQSGVTDTALNEWALDYAVSKEMTDCWNKVWRGKLDIFKSYSWFDTRNFCIVCSVISFSDDIPASMRGKEINSLYEWTKAESYYKTNYYDFLSDGQTTPPDKAGLNYRTDRTLAITFAHSKTAFLKSILPATLMGVTGGALTGNPWVAFAVFIATQTTSDDIKKVWLIPYDLLSKPLDQGGLGCTDIIA